MLFHKTEAGIRIDYVLDEAETPKADGKKRLALLIHGLTGHPCEHVHMMAMPLLRARGYDVARIYLYSDHPEGRPLVETTLHHHAADVNALLDHLIAKKGYQYIYAAGHSYGGLTLLMANHPKLTAAAFWDASFTPYKAFWKDCVDQFTDSAGQTRYSIRFGGVDHMIGQAMIDEAKNIDDKAESMAAAFTAPALVVLAGDNAENPVRTHLYDALPAAPDKSMIDIEGADHCFWRGETAMELAQVSCNWFDRY